MGWGSSSTKPYGFRKLMLPLVAPFISKLVLKDHGIYFKYIIYSNLQINHLEDFRYAWRVQSWLQKQEVYFFSSDNSFALK